MTTATDFLLLRLLSTTQQTCPSSSDETRLLTLSSISRNGRRFTNVLMVTTTVRVIDRIHGNTTSLGPAVALDGELVLGARSLEQGLVGAATTSNNTDHTAGGAGDDLLGAGRKLDACLALVGVVADDGDVVARSAAEHTAVTGVLLYVGDNGTLGHGAKGKDVADSQGGVLAGVDELAGVHALIGNEGLGVLLELVGVAEGDLGEGSTTARLVDDLLDHASDISMALGVVESPELGGSLAQAGVGG